MPSLRGVAVGGVAPEFALDAVRISFGFLVGLFVVDVVATRRRGAPFSDVTRLWRLDPLVTLGVLALVGGALLRFV